MKNSGSSTINIFKPINEGYDRLVKNFENVSTLIKKYSDLIECDSMSKSQDYVRSFSYIKKSFSDLKENFKEYYSTITENFNVINYNT
jgi:hypothetical protein